MTAFDDEIWANPATIKLLQQQYRVDRSAVIDPLEGLPVIVDGVVPPKVPVEVIVEHPFIDFEGDLGIARTMGCTRWVERDAVFLFSRERLRRFYQDSMFDSSRQLYHETLFRFLPMFKTTPTIIAGMS